jgi:hypothetical protein
LVKERKRVTLQKALVGFFHAAGPAIGAGPGRVFAVCAAPAQPFVPLDLNHEPGLACHFKVTQLERHPDASFSALNATGVFYTPLEGSPRGEACGKYDASPSAAR